MNNEESTGLFLLTVKEAAELLKVTEETVRKYAQSGRLKGFKTGRGDKHHWRFTKDSVVEFMVGSVAD